MDVSASIVKGETAALEIPRLLMKVIETRQPSLPVWTTRICVTVLSEEGPVIVGLREQLNLWLTEVRPKTALQCGNEFLKAREKFR